MFLFWKKYFIQMRVYIYGKYSEVGGGNLKNRTEVRKTLVCVCLMQNFKKKKTIVM